MYCVQLAETQTLRTWGVKTEAEVGFPYEHIHLTMLCEGFTLKVTMFCGLLYRGAGVLIFTWVHKGL